MQAMKIVLNAACVAIAIIGLGGRVEGGQSVKLVSVCDILGDAAKYGGRIIAVVGRADCDPEIADMSCFLAEDHCPRSLVIRGHRWPTKIWLQAAYGDEYFPQLSKEKFVVDQPAIDAKLALVRRSTKLGFHREMVFRSKDKKHEWANLKDEWGVAYGLVVFRPKLNPEDNCSGSDEGCGGWNETPVMLVVRTELDNFRTFADDNEPTQPKQ
jgi:hypothetical protein